MENIFPQQYEYISYKQKETLKLNLLVRERYGELTEAEKEQLEEYVKTHKTDSEKERRKNILQLKQSLKGMKITADDKRSMRNK